MASPIKTPDLLIKLNETCLKNGYVLLQLCGEGAYSSVYLAKSNKNTKEDARTRPENDNEYVAVKVLEVSFTSVKQKIRANTEWTIMRRLSGKPHPNVVSLLDSFSDGDYLFLVLEYAGTSLLRHLHENTFPETTAREIFKQVVEGVKYLHDNGVAHRDLKLENILINEEGRIRLCDFGFSSEFIPHCSDVTTGKCGTINYAAPEVKSSYVYAYRAKPADVWSLGAILYVICHRRKMPKISPKECIQKVLNISLNLTDDCCDLIRKMLRCHPLERITAEEILRQPWLEEHNGLPPTNANAQEKKLKLKKKGKKKSTKRFWALSCAIHNTSSNNTAAVEATLSNAEDSHKNGPSVRQTGHVALKGKPHPTKTFLKKTFDSKTQKKQIITSQLATFVPKQGNISIDKGLSADRMLSSQTRTSSIPKIQFQPKVNNGTSGNNSNNGKSYFMRPHLPPSLRKSMNFRNLRSGLKNYLLSQVKERKKVINRLKNHSEIRKAEQKLPILADDTQNWTREILKGNVASTALGFTRKPISKIDRLGIEVNQRSEFIQRLENQENETKGRKAPNNSPIGSTRTLKYSGKDQRSLNLKEKKYEKKLKPKTTDFIKSSSCSASSDNISIYSSRYRRSTFSHHLDTDFRTVASGSPRHNCKARNVEGQIC